MPAVRAGYVAHKPSYRPGFASQKGRPKIQPQVPILTTNLGRSVVG